MRFIFPVYHSKCDTCKDRFRCMTSKVDKELLSHSIYYETYIPFHINSNCFKTSPEADFIMIRNDGGGSRVSIKNKKGVSSNG